MEGVGLSLQTGADRNPLVPAWGPVPCHLAAACRGGEARGLLSRQLWRAWGFPSSSHPHPAAGGLLKYPRSRSPEAALASLQSASTRPSEGPGAPAQFCQASPRRAQMSAFGFPRSAGAGSGLPGSLGAGRLRGCAGESRRLRRCWPGLIAGHPRQGRDGAVWGLGEMPSSRPGAGRPRPCSGVCGIAGGIFPRGG